LMKLVMRLACGDGNCSCFLFWLIVALQDDSI
jgi:hypothetical protein